MLKDRIITAAILLPLIILAILFMPPTFFAPLLLVVFMVAAWEWTTLVGFKIVAVRWLYLLVIVIGVIVLTALPPTFNAHVFLILSLVWVWCLIAVIAFAKDKGAGGFHSPALRSLFGFLVMVPSFVAMLVLQSGLGHPFWLLYVLLVTFAADTGGYFVGRRFGSTPLALRVSPKKTWQGFWGGMIFAFLNAFVWSFCLPLNGRQRVVTIIFAMIAAAYSVVGDLIISLLKRIVGVKDTGSIIPGHGGILDRLDSVFAGTTIFVFLMIAFGLPA